MQRFVCTRRRKTEQLFWTALSQFLLNPEIHVHLVTLQESVCKGEAGRDDLWTNELWRHIAGGGSHFSLNCGYNRFTIRFNKLSQLQDILWELLKLSPLSFIYCHVCSFDLLPPFCFFLLQARCHTCMQCTEVRDNRGKYTNPACCEEIEKRWPILKRHKGTLSCGAFFY